MLAFRKVLHPERASLEGCGRNGPVVQRITRKALDRVGAVGQIDHVGRLDPLQPIKAFLGERGQRMYKVQQQLAHGEITLMARQSARGTA